MTTSTSATRPAVEPYDFRRPTTLPREHSRSLELAFETFARQWGTQLTANIRTRSRVEFTGVVIHTYDDYAASLPAATTLVTCLIGEESARGVIQFPTSAAFSWFGRMLGGTGRHGESERMLTRIEQTLLRKLVDDLLDDFGYSMGALLDDELAIDAVHHNSQLAQAAPTAELMIIAGFSVQTGDRTDIATLAVPADVVLRRLGDANPVAAADDAARDLRAHLAEVPVDVALSIPGRSITPDAVLALALGDIVPLHHHQSRPLELVVDGRPIARAALGSIATRLAGIVTDLTRESS